MNKNEQSRRKFLRLAATIVGTGALTGGGTMIYQMTRPPDQTLNTIWRLNPAFRINEISVNKVELYTYLSNGKILKHTFKGLEADLLRYIKNEKELDTAIPALAQRHNLTESKCQKLIMQSVHEFLNANLIYTGDEMLVKISEAKNE